MAIVYSSKNQYRKSIEKAQLALEIFREIRNLPQEIHCLINIGMSLNMLKEHKIAIEYYEQTLASISNFPEESGNLKDVYFGIAISNDGLLKYKTASKYYKKSLSVAIQTNDPEAQGRCYALLDTASFNLGHYRKSIYYSGQVLRIAEESRDTKTQITYCMNVAEDYHRTGQNEKALEYLWRGVDLLKDTPDDEKLFSA